MPVQLCNTLAEWVLVYGPIVRQPPQWFQIDGAAPQVLSDQQADELLNSGHDVAPCFPPLREDL